MLPMEVFNGLWLVRWIEAFGNYTSFLIELVRAFQVFFKTKEKPLLLLKAVYNVTIT